MTDRPRSGWDSSFADFRAAKPKEIRESLAAFIVDASPEQHRAWADSIPPLQTEVAEVLIRDELARQYSAILEYELPMESRRPDVILLVGSAIMVVELKGKLTPSQADLDQAAAYARDLRNYHRACADRAVIAVLVPTRAKGYQSEVSGVHVTGPDALDSLVESLTRAKREPVLSRELFLSDGAYCPLPTIVEAARELMESGTLRTIERAHASTKPAVDEIGRIIHQAALTKSRHLILLTGIPGAGKTLVGLQTVHSRYLDDLVVARADGKPTAPAVYLSGNGPLVEVLQYEMRSAGGDGKTFVRGVKEYVKRYSTPRSPVPPEHVLIFDEAQRAYDAAQVQAKHKNPAARSEPEEFIGFADRIPEWCVVVGLIGSGQEIHIGEEGGLGQWKTAVEGSPKRAEWTVHAPAAVAGLFRGGVVPFEHKASLNLDRELRFHFTGNLQQLVALLLEGAEPTELSAIAGQLDEGGYHLRITRSLETAKQYLRDRYTDDSRARFGIIASSRDKALQEFGVPNDFQSTKTMRLGPWYGDHESDYSGRSCRLLDSCVTEFGAQGLELDSVLLAWGTDLVRKDGVWSNALARGYKRGTKIKDPLQLRLNAYRVLLTRGRDGAVLFVPRLSELDETHAYLVSAGMKSLD